jgi:hypothetical protein
VQPYHQVRREVLHALPHLRRVSGGGGLVSRGGVLVRRNRRRSRLLMRGEGPPLFAQSSLYGLVVSGAMGKNKTILKK